MTRSLFLFSSLGFCRQRAKTIISSTRQRSSAAKIKINTTIHPRAAVAATIQWTCPTTKSHHYLLVQRKNPPDQNKWSCPGGKIELGEETLTAAKREIEEETQVRGCRWHSNSFLTTDAIVVDKQNKEQKGASSYAFHYVIAHCFARIPACASQKAPAVVPSDDALDARWWTLAELHDLECSEHTMKVINRAEELSDLGVLPV